MAVEAIRVEAQRFQVRAAKHNLLAEQKERSKRPLVARERVGAIQGVGRGLGAEEGQHGRHEPAHHEDRQPDQQRWQPVATDHDACV